MPVQIPQNQRVPLKTIFREKEFWLVVLLGVLYFYRPLFMGETFFFRDLGIYFFPKRQFLANFINMRELPLWNPYLLGGEPYLQHIANAVFYPSSLLYFFLPALRAFNLEIVLHVLYCLVFAYLFSRVIGFLPISSLIVALVFGFCGYTLSLINVLNHFWAVSHIPALLLFWHLFLSERSRKWFILTVITGVIQVFAGSPETNILSMIFLLGWALFGPFSFMSCFRRGMYWVILGVFLGGTASILLVPTVEMFLQSFREQGVTYGVFSYRSLPPQRLPEIIFPQFMGHVDNLLWDVYYWGKNVVDGEMPYVLSIYFGCVVVLLICAGGLHKGSHTLLARRTRIFLLSLFLLSLLFSSGRFIPYFEALYQYIPLLASFRYPIKFLIIGVFPVALLAGYASEVHFGRSSRPLQQTQKKKISSEAGTIAWIPSLKFLGLLWGTAFMLVLFTVAFMFSKDFAHRFRELFFNQSGGEIAYLGLRDSFIHVSAIWLLVTLLYQYRRLKQRQWQHWIFVIILSIDLLLAGKNVNVYAPEAFLTDVPRVVPIVRSNIGDGRFFRPRNDPPQPTLQVPSYNIGWMYRWKFEVLNDYLAAFYEIPVIFHMDISGMASSHLTLFAQIIDSLPWEERLPLLSAGGVTLILTSEALSMPGIHRIAEVSNRSGLPLYLYRNETAMSQIEFVTNWAIVHSDKESLKAVRNPDFDPRKHVVLQTPEPIFSFPFFKKQTRPIDSVLQSEKTQQAQNSASSQDECEFSSLEKEQVNFFSMSLSVSNNCDGYLVFSETYYPGWRISVDGKAVPILRANYAFSAVFLQAGNHQIEKYYRPDSLLFGIVSSSVFCCLLAFITFKQWLLK